MAPVLLLNPSWRRVEGARAGVCFRLFAVDVGEVLNWVVVLFSSDGLQPRHTHLPHRWAHAPGPWRERVGAPVQGRHRLLLDCVLVQRIACCESDIMIDATRFAHLLFMSTGP